MQFAGKDLLFSLRPSRHLHYSVVFALGFLIYNGLSFDPVSLITGIIVINLLFSSAMLINNIYDAEIDGINKKANTVNIIKMHESRYFMIYGAVTSLALLMAVFTGLMQFYSVLGLAFLSYIYSCPPLRLKKIFIVNLLLIGMAATGTIFLGYIWADGKIALKSFNYSAAIFMTLILAAAFSVKDVNDFEGDKTGKVMTLMTVFGEKKGRLITAVLAMLSYFAAPFAADIKNMTLYSAIAGVLTFIVVIKGKKVNEPVIFGILFVFLAVYLFINPIQ